jgi:hypothetical protein
LTASIPDLASYAIMTPTDEALPDCLPACLTDTRSPQLRQLRSLIKQWCSQQQQQQQQQLPWSNITAAYTAALAAVQPGGIRTATANTSSSSSSSDGLQDLLHQLLREGASLLREQGASLITCTHDSSLTAAWHTAAASSSNSSSSSGMGSRRYLMAANFHNSAAVLPNFVLQVAWEEG